MKFFHGAGRVGENEDYERKFEVGTKFFYYTTTLSNQK